MGAKKSKNTDVREKIVLAALELAETQGWEYTTLRDVAVKSGVAMPELFEVIEDKSDILTLFGRMIDHQVMDGVDLSVDDSLSARDRLFDTMMDRFEALNGHRAGVVALLDSMTCDPKQVIISFPHICKSMNWMLEACGVETSGIKGALKVVGLSSIYLKTLWVWRDDDSKDLAKTMAALDKALDRSEALAEMLGF